MPHDNDGIGGGILIFSVSGKNRLEHEIYTMQNTEILFLQSLKDGLDLEINPMFVYCKAVGETEAVPIDHRRWPGMGEDVEKQPTACSIGKGTQVCGGRYKFNA